MAVRVAACLAIAVASAALGACGSSSSSGSKTTSPNAGAEAHIASNWVAFFSSKTSASMKVSLLQHGAQFAAVINAQSKSPLAKESSAKVSAVKLTGAKTATVTYTVLLAGVPALKNVKGTAVDTSGTWQVSDASFCQLLKLQGSAPPACPKG